MVFANFYVPNGTLWLRQNTSAIGAFWGKDVNVGVGVELTLDNGIVIEDETPPTLSVTSPANNTITNAALITVSGTVSDENSFTVTVNGVMMNLGSNGEFTTQVSLVEGSNPVTVVATDASGNDTTVVRTVIRDSTPPVLTVDEPENNSTTSNAVIPVSGTVEDATAVTVTINGSPVTIEANGAFSDSVTLVEGPNTITVVATDAAGNITTVTRLVTLSTLPVIVAPQLDNTVATTLAAASSFLYTGTDPIQTGVDSATINPVRVSVLRGKVLTRNNQPLGGVQITILNHPEFGQTLSRSDGVFDMAVNGGGPLTVDYVKEGFLPAQRQVDARWQSFAMVDTVVMIPLDSLVTTIDFSEPIEVARGSVVTDASGTRQATLMFEQGTTATMILSDSSTQPLTSLHVRATEYSVGADGPRAMPALLPPSSAYTYCVELSADEAITAGAAKVQFSQPVSFYVDNFINFPVGTIVPVGYYDPAQGSWIPSQSGRVINILGVVDSLAQVDADGNGVAEDSTTLANLGFSNSERQQLAVTYSIGKTLWRAEIPHFSKWDFNWGISPPANARTAQQQPPHIEDSDIPNGSICGSIIGIQDQTLGEAIAVNGTPFRLHYQSDRTFGYLPSRTLSIPLSLGTKPLPNTLIGIEAQINVGGQTFTKSFPPVAGLEHKFTWGGNDAYGRAMRGYQKITTSVGYTYQGVYTTTPTFGYNGNGILITGTFGRLPLTLHEQWEGVINSAPIMPLNLSGWSLSPHHFYDFTRNAIMYGDGTTSRLRTILGFVINRFAGGSNTNNTADGIPARDFGLVANTFHGLEPDATGFAISPDGKLYFALQGGIGKVMRVEADGTVTTVAGGGTSTAEGTLAKNFNFLYYPHDLAFGADGTLYISSHGVGDPKGGRVFRLALDGKIYTFAGGVQRTPPDYGDGGPATQAFIPDACGLAIGPDGSVYISMRNTSRVRRVAPDGIISTFAGTGQIGFSGDGGPAINAKLFFPTGLSIDAEGNLYIADCRNNRIRRVTPSGIITTIAGNGVAIFSGDGGPATQASFVTPMDVACGPDGTLYITDSLNGRIRVVNSEGIIQTIAGKTAYYSFPPKYYGFVPDGVVALIADFSRLTWIAVAPDQSVYVSAQSFSSSHSIYRLTSPYPSYLAINLLIPSEDGSELYKFDSDGRHLKTTDALTGNALYTFEYDSLSNLTGVRDLDNLLTRIDRDSTGMPTAIVSPFGQRTELEADTSGFLADIRNAANETHSFVYDSTGLMAQMFDPKNNLYRFTYDSTGRLIKEEDPAGGFKTLARTTLADGSEVTVTTAEGQTSTYRIEKLATGGTRRTNTDAAGLATVTTETPDGVTTTTSPDGTITTVNLGPDPRFAMQAPLAKSTTVRMPSGLQSNSEHKRVITQMSGLQVTGIADTLIINGRKYVSVFDGNQKRYTFTSPEGRKTFAFIDSLGRVVQDSIPGVISVTSKYDSQGFLTQTSQDGRTSSFTYDGRGRLATVTDPLQRTTSTFYDSVGRVTRQVLPDTREILYAYDANGNLSSLTPPGRPAHSFDYTTVDLTQRYTPPLLNGDTTATRYKYDLDKRIKNTIRPDSVAVSVFYDTLGCGSCPSDARPKTIIFDRGTLDFAYNPTTGLLSSLSAPGGNVLTYTYDGTLPSSVTWSGEVMGSVGVAYDNNFRVTTQTVNSGNSVTFQYDRDGLLTSAGLLSIAHDPQNGRITGTTLGSVTTSQAYNAFGEMKNFSAVFASDTLFKTVYAPDSLGRITEIIETIQGQTRKLNYTYDQAGRLSEVSRNDTLVSIYTYDANGNRMSRITPSDTVNGSYDSQDRLLTYGGASYSYTRNGELSIKIVGTDTTRYTYDAFGNLVKVIMPNGDVIEYVIDGQNRRVGKKVNGNLKRRWLYQNGLNVIAELDGIGNMVSRFVYGTRPNTPDYVIKGGTIYRIVSDHLGSVRLVANTNSGAVTQQINYDEFGNVVFDSNPGFQPFSYAGGLYDEQTKLVRFGARDYEPMTGRWAQKDPIGFRGGQWNLYQYVGNNPVNFLDPNGFFFPGDHYDMSYMAARNLGFSIEAAKRIGYYTALADKDTQGKEWYFTRIHAMAGEIQIDENTSRYQTREEAMASTRAFVDEELRSANEALKIGDCESYYRGLGNALHAIQDRWAPLHNYSEWHPSIWSNIAHGLTHTFGVGLRTHYAPAVRSSEIFLGGDIAGALR